MLMSGLPHRPQITDESLRWLLRLALQQLMRQIMRYDAEFRCEEATSAVGSQVKH